MIMAYDVDLYFSAKSYSVGLDDGSLLPVVECLACGALVSLTMKKFHYELHLKHRDLPRQNNR
jgi:hypothetical protein